MNLYSKLFEGKFIQTHRHIDLNIIEKLYYNFSSSTYTEKTLFKLLKKYTTSRKEDLLILDVGCGGGHERLCKYGKIVGIDISQQSIKNASKIYPYTAIVDITKKLPFKSECFDIIFSSEVYGHISVKDKNKFLSEINRVLKKNGLIFMSVETIGANLFTLWLKRKNKYIKYWIDYMGHIGLQTPKQTLITIQFFFKILEIKKTSSWLLPADGYLMLQNDYKFIKIFNINIIRRIFNIVTYPLFILINKLSSIDSTNDLIIVGKK